MTHSHLDHVDQQRLGLCELLAASLPMSEKMKVLSSSCPALYILCVSGGGSLLGVWCSILTENIGPSTALDHHKCTTSVTVNSTHYSNSIIVDN